MTDPRASATKCEATLVDLMLRVHQQFVTELDLAAYANLPPDVLRCEIRNASHSACDTVCARGGIALSQTERKWLIESVLDEAFGLGPLEPLLKDPATEAILIRSPRVVLVEREGRVWDTAVVFRDDEHIQNVLERNRWKDCVTEVCEAEVRSHRFDVRRLRAAFAQIDAESKAKANLVSGSSREHQSRVAQGWIERLWARLFARR